MTHAHFSDAFLILQKFDSLYKVDQISPLFKITLSPSNYQYQCTFWQYPHLTIPSDFRDFKDPIAVFLEAAPAVCTN